MATGQHATADILSESKYQRQRNEKSTAQIPTIDRRKSDMVLAQIGSP
jgi:hypothetical protein